VGASAGWDWGLLSPPFWWPKSSEGTLGCRNLRHACSKMVGHFHPLQRVADGPSPTRETTGVAVDGSVSRDPTVV